ncbi:Chaperone J-domain superfamily [Arabidopsis suecica]|uniref:Chaperone J-domain superfamily n=1 Tax=Arabidopsis suecica TaxID=45249 RepID=A0A8T1XEB6_ARASU|nr:Chaperone J-domain superfamily [Arabidopsis suecica]
MADVNGDKKHWWFTHRKLVDKYIKDATTLMASEEANDVASALHLLDAALSISPRLETALELKARSLLFLRRFKDVADMLQDYIPSLKLSLNDEEGSASSQASSSDGLNLLSDASSPGSFKCFSVSDLKKKVMAGICKKCDKQGQWRYVVLGQACCHLGLMEDAMVLLQTGKRLASAEFRRRSICWSDDSFLLLSESSSASSPPPESENFTHLLAHIKLLLRRRAAAIAALDAGLFSESIRHFSKIVDGRRPAPQGFLAECYMHRAAAYRSAGRIAEAIADCNKTLALEPSCIQALETRAALLETVRCFPDSLHDLEHLKLLYNTILRDRKLPGPVWKRHNVKYREIPGKLCVLTTKTQKLKQKIANGETGNVDYYGLIGVRRGCTRSELDRAHLLLCLRYKPDRASSFIERCEFTDQNDVDSVRDRAKMSSLLLYRLIQKGYSAVTAIIAEEQRKSTIAHAQKIEERKPVEKSGSIKITGNAEPKPVNSNAYQGVFCRDLAAVGNLLTRAGFNHPIPVKYEALTC